MNKRFFLLFLICFINFGLADGFSIEDKDDPVTSVSLAFGEAWKQEERSKKMFSKICPYLDGEVEDGAEGNHTGKMYCFIEDIDFDKLKMSFSKKANLEFNVKTSDAGIRNIKGGAEEQFDIKEFLFVDDTGNEDEKDKENKEILEYILTGKKPKAEDGSNKEKISDSEKYGYVIPLKIAGIKSFAYNTYKDSDDSYTNSCLAEPYFGFLALKYSNNENNKFVEILGQEDKSGGKVYCSKNKEDFVETSKNLTAVKLKNEKCGFECIGKTLNKWAGFNTGYSIDGIKRLFNKDANDSARTWSRIMSGVATLDDEYISELNKDGELITTKDAKQFDIAVLGDLLYFALDDDEEKNIFDNISDKKLWGFYLYLSQNLHTLEMFLILGLAGGIFTFSTGWKGFNYLRLLKTEQKDPLDWKKMVMQPITYTLLVATPMINTNITFPSDGTGTNGKKTSKFILGTNIQPAEVEIKTLSHKDQDTNTGSDDITIFHRTPLQAAIQEAVSFGAAIADEFSKATTFSFATFLAYRENIIDDGAELVSTMRQQYAELSKKLIALSAYQSMYLSTCKYDYSQVQGEMAKEIKDSYGHIYPKPLNGLSQNDLMNFEKQFIGQMRHIFKPSIGYLSPSACQKLENWLNENSEPLAIELAEFHQKFTYHANVRAQYKDLKEEGTVEVDKADSNSIANDLAIKIRKLGRYEEHFGWINTAMIPLLYQVMYPSFNPYYYSDKVLAQGSTTKHAPKPEELHFREMFRSVGHRTVFNNQVDTKLNINSGVDKINANDNNIRMMENFLISSISYSFLPGYSGVEQQLKAVTSKLVEIRGQQYQRRTNERINADGAVESAKILYLLNILSEKTLNYSGAFSLGEHTYNSLMSMFERTGKPCKPGDDKCREYKEKDLSNQLEKKDPSNQLAKSVYRIINANGYKAEELMSEMLLKATAQTLYLYILNLMVMLVLTMILVFKIGMYFVQVIMFYIASPLVIVWAMITKKEDQIKNFIGKSATLVLTPVLIVISSAILILAVGTIHQIYFIITNHILNIQLGAELNNPDELYNLAQYIQMQTYFGIGNVIIGFAYLFLGYIILVKFSQWFFETVGIQTQSTLTQSVESMTHRMRFGGSFGM